MHFQFLNSPNEQRMKTSTFFFSPPLRKGGWGDSSSLSFIFYLSFFIFFLLLPNGDVFAGSCECKTSNLNAYGTETIVGTECKPDVTVEADCATFDKSGRPDTRNNINGQVLCTYTEDNCGGEGTEETLPAAGTPTTARIAIPQLQIRIPGLKDFQAPTEVSCGGNKRCLVIPWIGIYIGALYTYALSIITLVAVAMIMVGGVVWLTAGGSSERVGKAKEYIAGALTGLLIALFSYTMLATINPALVRFEDIQVQFVSSVEGVGNNTCNLDLNSVVMLQNAPGLQGNGKQVTKAVEEKLKNAVVAANTKGYTITVNSGIRSTEKQQELRKCYEERDLITKACPAGCASCNLAAPANCNAPHAKGIAIDVTLSGGGLQCGEVKESNNCRSQNIKTSDECEAAATACQDELYTIMTAVGFQGIQAEWWHFEAK